MMELSLTVYQLLGCMQAHYALRVFHTHVTNNPKMTKSYGGNWKYLTFINLQLQNVFFSLGLLQCATSAFNLTRVVGPLKEIKDLMFSSVALPLTLFVVLVYWVGVTFDETQKEEFDWRWITHVFHTAIITIALECYYERVRYPQYNIGAIIFACFLLCYLAWICFLNSVSGEWPYPALGWMSPLQRAVGFFTLFWFGVMLYFLGEKLNTSIQLWFS